MTILDSWKVVTGNLEGRRQLLFSSQAGSSTNEMGGAANAEEQSELRT